MHPEHHQPTSDRSRRAAGHRAPRRCADPAPPPRRRRALALLTSALTVLAALAAVTAAPPPPADAATGSATGKRVDLRVLVLLDGSATTGALVALMDREGVPYTAVNLDGYDQITPDFLADAGTGTGRYQAIVTSGPTGSGLLSAAEQAAVASYEREYGVRHVNSYVWPNPSFGVNYADYSGTLDGRQATVTTAGRSAAFPAIDGPVTFDDDSASMGETYGYLVNGLPDPPAGQSFTPLVTASAVGENGSTVTGSVIGVFAHDFREELVITVAYSENQRWFSQLGHGIVTWMTRGLHLGHHRNHLAVQVDDVLLPDSRWSVAGACTPGDTCTNPALQTTDIRMTPADVTRLVDFVDATGFAPDLIFNAAGSVTAALANNGTDPLTAALTASTVENRFHWINHTYTHTFLGCVQLAPAQPGGQWRCAGPGDPQSSFLNEDLALTDTAVSGDTRWLSEAAIRKEIQDNTAWATGASLTRFDPEELVTGEHSGLATLPQQVADNPFLAPALAGAGVSTLASDASRESTERVVGPATTAPRHPLNVYYNAATFTEEVDEYNWIYTSAADGGSGICSANPMTSTCITPLPAATPAQAENSFHGYIKPLEVSIALRYILSGDPRPFFAHQSNLAEDGILYPIVQGILDAYDSSVDTTMSPLVHTGLTGQARALTRATAWTTARDTVSAYVDTTGVHVSGAAGVEVPLTVPTGTDTGGVTLEPYDGELSGWLPGGATDTVVAVPPTPMGGYVGVTTPPAPTASATAGDASAVVTWTSTGDGGTPVTGWTVQVFEGDGDTPVRTLDAPADATELRVTDLVNGTGYTFSVTGVNGVGAGEPSARTALITPLTPPVVAPGAPTIGTAAPGDTSATVRWTAPTDDGGSPVTE